MYCILLFSTFCMSSLLLKLISFYHICSIRIFSVFLYPTQTQILRTNFYVKYEYNQLKIHLKNFLRLSHPQNLITTSSYKSPPHTLTL